MDPFSRRLWRLCAEDPFDLIDLVLILCRFRRKGMVCLSGQIRNQKRKMATGQLISRLKDGIL